MDGEAVKVEDLALQHYASEEHGSWQGQLLHAGAMLPWLKGPVSGRSSTENARRL